MLGLTTILLCGAALTQAAPYTKDAGVCDFATFAGCAQLLLFDPLHIQLNLNDSAAVDAAVDEIFESASNTFVKACYHVNKFKRCVEPEGSENGQMEACMNASVLQSNGAAPHAAVDLILQLARMVYFCECDSAFGVIHENWDCIRQTTIENHERLNQCKPTYQREMALVPVRVCSWTNEYLDCMTHPYRDCGVDFDHQVSTTLCFPVLKQLTQQHPSCSLRCFCGGPC